MYSDDQRADIQHRVCQEIAIGKSLRTICLDKDIPDQTTIYAWLSEDEAFSKQYARAREEQADYYADEIIDIADTESDASKARNRIDARKWKASKLQPKKYGDRVEHTGPNGGPIEHRTQVMHATDEELEKIIADKA